jgi:hypothetical protein
MWTPPGRLLSVALIAVALPVFALTTVGCRGEAAAGSYAAEVEPRLRQAGFQTWFPPEEGVEVGQIWSVDGAGNRAPAYGRPAAVDPPAERPAPFLAGLRGLTLKADEALRLADGVAGPTGGAGPAAGAASDAGATGADGPLRAALTAAGVESARVDLGEPSARELPGAALDRPEVLARLSGPYREALAAGRSGSPRHVCVAGVVEVAGLTCTWAVADAAPVAAALPQLNAAFGPRVAVSVVDRRTVRAVVPPSRRLAVGIRRLVGGAGFAAPASPSAVAHNLDHLATFDQAAGVRLGWDGGRRVGVADRAAFAAWLGRFRPQPGVDERVADLSAAVAAAPDLTDPDSPHRTYPGTVRLSARDVATLVDAQRVIADEAVSRGLATVEEAREKARVGQ